MSALSNVPEHFLTLLMLGGLIGLITERVLHIGMLSWTPVRYSHEVTQRKRYVIMLTGLATSALVVFLPIQAYGLHDTVHWLGLCFGGNLFFKALAFVYFIHVVTIQLTVVFMVRFYMYPTELAKWVRGDWKYPVSGFVYTMDLRGRRHKKDQEGLIWVPAERAHYGYHLR